VWHHSRAHRFFAAARWHPDRLGLTVLRLIVGHFDDVEGIEADCRLG
jgi:hypothetical protein